MGASPGDRDGTESEAPNSRRPWALVGAVIAAVVVAAATAIGTGLGSSVLESIRGDKEVVSSSAEEQVYECGTALFVAGERAKSLALGHRAAAEDWRAFRRENKAVAAGRSVVEVSIQGESARKITLTRINFFVERKRRAPGRIFTNPCGGELVGRQVEVNLDKNPAAVIASSENPGGTAGGFDSEGRRVKPIAFPWTVSITDPLLLMVVATTKRCYCVWRAEIPWRSGGESGVIRVDNGGRGYPVVGEARASYVRDASSPSGWRRVRVLF